MVKIGMLSAPIIVFMATMIPCAASTRINPRTAKVKERRAAATAFSSPPPVKYLIPEIIVQIIKTAPTDKTAAL